MSELESMATAALEGLSLLFTWPTFGYMLIGVVIGMFFGIVPGLSGLTGMALLLPFAFGKSPAEAFAFLLGMYVVTTVTDSIPAILIGVPGTVAAQAIVVDGHPMAKNGEAERAFGANYASDLVGVIVGAVILSATLPIIRPIITQLASPEMFMLGLLGLAMVGSLSGKKPLRGIIMAAFGLMISMIGMAPQSGTPRFDYGLLYLWDGVNLVPAILGLFGLPEIIELAVSRTPVSQVPPSSATRLFQGIKDVISDIWLTIRCSAIGAWVGFVPALGGTVAEWLGYGHAVQSAKDTAKFGKGDVRGVIGPQSAVAAQKPGALIPTIAFGIPGNPSMALLLGAFLIVGLKPGPEMLTTHLNITFLMMWITVIANFIAVGLCLLFSRQFAKISFIRGTLLVPIMMAFMMIGSISATGSFGDIIVFATFGLFGYFMELAGWPRPPLVLGLILGGLLETYLFIAVHAHGYNWFNRPLVVVFAVCFLITVLSPVWKNFKNIRKTEHERPSMGG